MPAPELTSVDGESRRPQARIPAADDGLLRGDGVFEVIRLYAETLRADRAPRPPRALGRRDRADHRASALEDEISRLLFAFGEHEGQLRLVCTRGGRRLAFTENLPARGETVRLATVTYAPSEILNGVKSLSYAANMQSTRLAQGRGADEAVLVRPDGVVLEAPTSTVFWVSYDGVLLTPALDVGILASITRAQIVRELHVEEGGFQVEDLRGTHEAFLASTVRRCSLSRRSTAGSCLPALASGPAGDRCLRRGARP
jgi:branched-chain amino acid aminotransferase